MIVREIRNNKSIKKRFALVLATPTAIMAAIGNATKHGFLVREGDALERLAGVKMITFDKTGTLTFGNPEVVAAELCRGSSCASSRELLRMAAAAERLSEHPLGKAVVRYFKETEKEELPTAEAFVMTPGQGIAARIEGRDVLAGNSKLMEARQITFPDGLLGRAKQYLEQGATIIYLAADGKPEGFLALADTLRPQSADMIRNIRGIGAEPVLLTGDAAQAAHTIAGKLQIAEVYDSCLPETKLRVIESYQRKGKKVCMIGDGINDAPALRKADVGIAMGGIGSDIAVDAADSACDYRNVKSGCGRAGT